MSATGGSDSVVEMAGAVKRFGRTRALDGLDLTAAGGEVHGLLGPNGAGKTTAIRVMLGLQRADRGAVRVLGGDPWRDAVRLHRRMAYVPGDVTLWPKLTGGETIDLLARLRGDTATARRDELLERFDLDPTKKASAYSKGNRQKVALVAALSSSAELLILDEPTSGLDPLMEAVFQQCVREAKSQGRTVLLSSHILAEVEALCDRVSIIRAGRAVQTGTLAEMRHLTRTTVSVETSAAPQRLHTMPGVHNVTAAGRRATFDVDADHLGDVVRHLAGLGVRSLSAHPPTLEELFLRHYGRQEDPSAAAGSRSPTRRGRPWSR